MKDEAKTILLVEDNPAAPGHAEQLLSALAYSFIKVGSVAQAIDCVGEKHFDAVLLDLSLPDSASLDTIKSLVSQRSELPIIVLTGLEDITCAMEALRAGANDYIVKSKLSTEALSRSITSAIEIKKRQQAQEEVLNRTLLASLTADVGQALAQATTFREMLTGCTDAIVKQLDAAFARIWTVADRENVLILQASSGLYTHIDKGHARIPIGKFKVGLIASERKPHLTNDVQNDPRVSDRAWAKKEGMVAFAGHPLLVGDRLVGVVAMFARQPLGDIALSGLSAVADQIAIGIDRRVAEDARALLASIVQCSEDGIMSTNLAGDILSWNQSSERIFGFSADEIIGKNVELVMPKDGGRELLRLLNELRQGKHIEHFEAPRLRKDGIAIEVSLTLSPIRDNFGTVTGVSAIVREITKRKRLELLSFSQNEVTRILSVSDSLSEASTEILRLMAKTGQFDFGAMWCLDREQKLLRCVDVWHDPEPNLTEFAALSKHVTIPAGTTLPGRILASGKGAVIPELKADAGFVRIAAASKGGLSSGFGVPSLLGAKVLGVMEFFSRIGKEPDQDLLNMITNVGAQIGQFIDRKHSEEAAKRAIQAQLKIGQAILEHAPIGIAWLDKNLVITEANHAFSEQFGVDRSGLIGTYIFQIPTGIPTEQLIDVVQQGVPLSVCNFQMDLSDTQGATETFCDLTVWPVKDVDDCTVGLVLLTVEVTERVKLSKQREDFAATLTHDMKNPLIGQHRMLELFLQGALGPLQTEQVKMLNLILIGTQELLQLIGTLLEVYRYESGAPQLQLEEFDVKNLITGCIAQQAPIAEAKSIKIVAALSEHVDVIFADQMALKRVVMNLLDNAVKFTPDQGLIEVACMSTGTSFIITVADNGSGISEDEIKLLFQRFSQGGSGRRYRVGTGLGLYLCRQIVAAHIGTITCSSEEGRGATFVVTLPKVPVPGT